MRDILSNSEPEIHLSDPDPIRRAQKKMLTPLPKRIYSHAQAGPFENAFAVLLDGKPVRTPSGAYLLLPSMAAASLVADEYEAQVGEINPATMPCTRLANTAIDGVSGEIDAVFEDIKLFSSSDLVCYRSEGPEALVERQAKAWDSYLKWAETALGARFLQTRGIIHVEQPAEAIAAIGNALKKFASPVQAACLHSMTTLTGSALLALAVAEGHVSASAAWSDAHVDEDWTNDQWGVDDEAAARRANRWREMKAAAELLAASN